MSLLNPLALLLVGLFGPLLVILHLLRRSRPTAVVSSTFLWRHVVRDVTIDAPWQRMRRNLLFILQFLALLLLVVALARPYRPIVGSSAAHLILIVDVSASMAAEHNGRSRLTAAVADAAVAVRQLPDGGRTTLLIAGRTVRVPLSAVADRGAVLATLYQLQIDPAADSDLRPALQLAAALAEQQADSQIVVLSDGNVRVDSTLRISSPFRFIPIGESVDNAAISNITLTATASARQLSFQLTSYSSRQTERRVLIYVDGVLQDAFDVALEPGLQQTLSRDLPASVERVEVRFEQPDALPLDDVGRAVLSDRQPAVVQLLSAGNRYLATALRLMPGIVIRETPATGPLEGDAELTIFDGVIPAEIPDGNLLFINPPASTEWFTVNGRSLRPQISSINPASALLGGLSLSDVTIERSQLVQAGPWATTLIAGDAGPLLLVGEQGGRRIGLLTFDLAASDLPLNPGFPVLISQLLNYLAPVAERNRQTFTTAEALPWPAAALTHIPDGAASAAVAGVSFDRTAPAPGWYQVSLRDSAGAAGVIPVAVNLAAGRESQLATLQQLALPLSADVTDTAVSGYAVQEWKAPIIGLGILIVLLEWLAYYWDRPRRQRAPEDVSAAARIRAKLL